ncbi:ADOP family duplicated permease [Lonsdalea quercina]|uniref:ADOP family duplicated permease n=1 Tax=Lonsdalea quercina TaxID=71657 RepID=UPI003976ADAE
MSMIFDLRYACRLLLKRPGFSVFTMLIMAIGLGMCIYMYSVINGLVLKPLPFHDAERMVVVSPSINGVRLGDSPISYMDFMDLKAKSQRLEQLGYYYGDVANISLDGQASRYIAIRSEPDLFSFTGVQPELGRIYNQQDTGEGANPVAVISHEMWQNYFGGRQDILNRSFMVNGISTRIIGVMPEGFAFPMNNQIWLPSTLNPRHITVENAPSIQTFGKIKPGFSAEDVDAELKNIMDARAQQFPEINRGRSAFVITFMDSFMGEDSKPIFLIMLLAVGLVLLLACCNVGNMLLVRAIERSKETAIRIAHGAPPLRVVLQMMWESAIICCMGGVIGLLLAGWGLSLTNTLIVRVVPDQPPFWWHLGIDAATVIKTLALVALASLMTGALPAWKMVHSNVNDVLRDGTRGAQSRSSSRISRALVIFEVALSCAVLCIGALLSLVVAQASKIDYGVQQQNVWSAKVSLPDRTYPTALDSYNFDNRIVAELNAQPAVEQAGLISRLPGEFTPTSNVEIEGASYLRSNRNQYPRVNDVIAYPGTLEALGVNAQLGRLLNLHDDNRSQKVVVVTRSFIDRYLPGESMPIGKKIRWFEGDDRDWYTLVGVIPHIIQGRPFGHSKGMPTAYRSMLQAPQDQMSIIVKGMNHEDLSHTIQSSLSRIDSQLPAYQEKTLQEVVGRNTVGLSYISILFNLFGIMAVLLAGSGIYGVMAKTIHQRYAELGTRRALGATPANIISLILIQGWWQLAIGLVISLPVIGVVTPMILRIFGSQGIALTALFVAMALLIAAVVTVATLVPARRAIQIQPIDALRHQ